tara:strand:- start:1205 stop:1942 length:738 start_codon:yes stop_codon:yes gene_type:complete
LAGAWIFYTVLPKIPFIEPKFDNIAQFSPLIGIFIGVIQSYIFLILNNNSWPIFACSLICLISGYLITGGLHLDGLMDTFDGIYASKKKRLKAMKDSRVGSYGVQSILVITFIQLASITKIENSVVYALPICLFLGRLSTLIFIEKFKYLKYKRKYHTHKKFWRGLGIESKFSILLLILIIIFSLFVETSVSNLNKIIILSLGLVISYKVPMFLGNKMGGVNGDTCGASVVLTETIMMFVYSLFL